MEPEPYPVLVLPAALSEEAAAALLEILQEMTRVLESHYTTQLRRHHPVRGADRQLPLWPEGARPSDIPCPRRSRSSPRRGRGEPSPTAPEPSDPHQGQNTFRRAGLSPTFVRHPGLHHRSDQCGRSSPNHHEIIRYGAGEIT